MAQESLFFSDDFWRTIEGLDSLQGEVSLANLLEDLRVSPRLFTEARSFLKEFDYEIKLKEKEGQTFVSLPKKEFMGKKNLGLWEYFSLKMHSPQGFDGCEGSKQREKAKLLTIFTTLEGHRREEIVIENHNPISKGKLETVDEALLQKNSLFISLHDGKKKEVFPYHMIFIEGKLTLVGEDCTDRCLVAHEIDEIARVVSVSRKGYKPHFSVGEIKDFVSALHEMSGKEARLVLKLSTAEKFDLSPRHHFLGNPYVTTNGEGDMIWAATVEVSHELFDWLYSIRWAIKDFMDPQSVQEEFLNYCKEREKRVA